jgi:hypothetical protein
MKDYEQINCLGTTIQNIMQNLPYTNYSKQFVTIITFWLKYKKLRLFQHAMSLRFEHALFS